MTAPVSIGAYPWADAPKTNIDLLAWFSEDERDECCVCHERASVTIPEARAAFCLACATITIEGVPITVGATRVA